MEFSLIERSVEGAKYLRMVDDLPLNFYHLVMVGIELEMVVSLWNTVWAVRGVEYLALNFHLLGFHLVVVQVSQPY